MTITNSSSRIAYTGNGVTVAFSFPYAFDSQDDLVVLLAVTTTGIETVQTITTHYTISGTTDSLGRYPTGGTVTFVTAPTATTSATIYRDPEAVQELDLPGTGLIPAESLEAELDYLTMLAQRTRDIADRSVRITEGESSTDAKTLLPFDRANKYLTFGSGKELVAMDGQAASGTSVTATGSTTARLLAARFADYVNVKDWGAVGDGVASDQTAVAAAIAAAVASGQEVYWPDGTYLTTATIPTFHSARHRGPGILKRGSTLFYPDPSTHPGVTNNLYVATTGSNTNDGLTSSEPRLTTQSAGDLLYGYPWSDVTWQINFAAGTYLTTSSTSFLKPFPGPNRVIFAGVSVGTGVQPTVIFQATTPTTHTVGWYFQNNIRVKVANIQFKNYRTAASPSSNSLALGLTVDGRSDLYAVNVWADDCDQGIYVANQSQARIEGGRFGFTSENGCSIQGIRDCTLTVGYNGTAADITGVTGTALIDGAIGILLQEFTMGHADFCYFSAQSVAGVFLTTSGRCNSNTSTYVSCALGITARQASNISVTTNTFTTCTRDISLVSNSTISGDRLSNYTDVTSSLATFTSLAATSSVTPVTVYTRSFVAKDFQRSGSGFRLFFMGTTVGTAGTKTHVVALGATTLLTATIAATTAAWSIEVVILSNAITVQRCLTTINQNGVLPVIAYTSPTADLATALDLTVTHQVTNAADSVRTTGLHVELIY